MYTHINQHYGVHFFQVHVKKKSSQYCKRLQTEVSASQLSVVTVHLFLITKGATFDSHSKL